MEQHKTEREQLKESGAEPMLSLLLYKGSLEFYTYQAAKSALENIENSDGGMVSFYDEFNGYNQMPISSIKVVRTSAEFERLNGGTTYDLQLNETDLEDYLFMLIDTLKDIQKAISGQG